MTVDRAMPLKVGVRLTHAAVQAIADEAGVDVLHIKGPAVHPSLLATVEEEGPDGETVVVPRDRGSIDADVLVRPRHVVRLLDAMRDDGTLAALETAYLAPSWHGIDPTEIPLWR